MLQNNPFHRFNFMYRPALVENAYRHPYYNDTDDK